MEDSAHPRGRTVRSGLLTGLSIGLVSLSAAGAGIVLSRKFGHGVKTDGFFAAYAVYLALVLVATALRVVVLPGFVRARRDGRLGGDVTTWLAALAVPLVPVLVLCVGWPDVVARALAADPQARHAAASLLPWLVPAASAQIAAGVFASALASLDDYAVAAASFGGGAVAGLVVIVALVGHGVVAFGWGLARQRGDRRRWSARRARDARCAASTRCEPAHAVAGACRGRVASVRAAGPLPRRLPLRERARHREGDDALLRVPDRSDARRRHGDVDRARLDGAVRARRADAAAGRAAHRRDLMALARHGRRGGGCVRARGRDGRTPRARLAVRRGHRRGARAARRLLRAVDGRVDRGHGRVSALVRPRTREVAAAARGRRARAFTCWSSGADAGSPVSAALPAGSR